MFQHFFSSLALSPTQFTTFFLDGGSYVLYSLIKSTLLAGKDLLSLVDKIIHGRLQIRNFSSRVQLDGSRVSAASLARTRETSSGRLEEKSYVCTRHVLFTNNLEFTSED